MKTITHLFKQAFASLDDSRGKYWVAARKKALRRDWWTCQVCGKRKVVLDVHHICGWAWFPLLRFELSNLVTLCKVCHKDFHQFNGGTSKKCDEKDYEKWLASRTNASYTVPLWVYGVVLIALSYSLFNSW